jgi:hypothetical protein
MITYVIFVPFCGPKKLTIGGTPNIVCAFSTILSVPWDMNL